MIALFLAATSATTEAPRAFVERIYASYRNEKYSPFDHPEKVFAPRLNAAIKDDARLAHGEVGFLDGDPVCDCQDTGGMHSKVLSVARSGATATADVLVTWERTADRRDIKLGLVRTQSGWRISDVDTADDPNLLGALEKSNREQPRNRH